MCRVMRAFVCGGCVNQVTGTGRTGVDVGDIAGLELVDKFCCLGGMLGVDGSADVAMEIIFTSSTPLCTHAHRYIMLYCF